MYIEREILGVDVTIEFDDYGYIENIEVDVNNLEVLADNLQDFNNQAEELVRDYLECLQEEAEDRIFERKRGY